MWGCLSSTAHGLLLKILGTLTWWAIGISYVTSQDAPMAIC